MQENYRNASQITNYCNHVFGMNMVAINTPGKGVHEINNDDDFHNEIISQLTNSQRAGIGAILVSSDMEAKYLRSRFARWDQKFHDMTGDEYGLHQTRWNVMKIDDAKGLEFSSVIVLAGRMSRNQRYIAYTRALDDLYIYADPVYLNEYLSDEVPPAPVPLPDPEPPTDYLPKPPRKFGTEVKQYFEQHGIEVIDKRGEGGRLWAIGEKDAIRDIVNEAISRFKIAGKYVASNESNNRNGWCTKTEK